MRVFPILLKTIIFYWLFVPLCLGGASSESKSSSKDVKAEIKVYDERIRHLENENIEIKNDLVNKTLGMYEITNNRLNSHITWISLVATIFGVIIALGGIWIGYESIRARKQAEEAIRTLDQAKTYVEDKKQEFDAAMMAKRKMVEDEIEKLLSVLKEQLFTDVNTMTRQVKTVAESKTQEIRSYSLEEKSEEALEALNRRIAFFENVGIPDDPKILLSKAKLLGEKKMTDEAIELLKKLVKLDPKNADGFWGGVPRAVEIRVALG